MNTLLKTILALVSLLVVALCALLFLQYQHVQHLGYMSSHESWFGLGHAHKPMTVNDASSTQTWMTFDYINHVFTIPPQYLQKVLLINDPRYPHLTIAQYATDAHMSPFTALDTVINAIRTYVVVPNNG